MDSDPASACNTVQFAVDIGTERRLVHLVAGVSISVAGLLLPWPWIMGILAGLFAVAVAMEAVRLWFYRFNQWIFRWLGVLLKRREWNRPTGASYMSIGALAAFLVFPKEVAALSVLFLAVGDPVAALIGGRASGPRVWGKSLWGSSAFMAATLILAVMVSAWAPLDFGWPIAIGAVVAALAELLPDPVDDNLKIPLLSGFTIMLLA